MSAFKEEKVMFMLQLSFLWGKVRELDGEEVGWFETFRDDLRFDFKKSGKDSFLLFN